jgi:hypothetical protein
MRSPFVVQPFACAQIYPIDLTPQKKPEKLHEVMGASALSTMRSRNSGGRERRTKL